MSEKSSEKLIEAPEEANVNSVYDFLYYDVTRLASFLSQFEPSGHLTALSRVDNASRRKTSASKDEVSGSLALLKGVARTEEASELLAQRQKTSTFDPRWVNALNFLDYLEERSLLHRDIELARIGQIVMLSGSLSMFDLGMLKQMWGLASVKKLIGLGAKAEQGNRKDRRAASAGKGSDSPPNNVDLSLDLLSVLPHAVQAAVTSDSASGWMNLKEEHIAISPSDLFFKHGIAVDGDWTVVGILDALPTDDDAEDGESAAMLDQLRAGTKLGALGVLMAPHLALPVRQLMGRPNGSYGLTPLLLFREVSGSD